jgi:hypothetical protein
MPSLVTPSGRPLLRQHIVQWGLFFDAAQGRRIVFPRSHPPDALIVFASETAPRTLGLSSTLHVHRPPSAPVCAPSSKPAGRCCFCLSRCCPSSLFPPGRHVHPPDRLQQGLGAFSLVCRAGGAAAVPVAPPQAVGLGEGQPGGRGGLCVGGVGGDHSAAGGPFGDRHRCAHRRGRKSRGGFGLHGSSRGHSAGPPAGW